MNKRMDKEVLADLGQVASESQQALMGTLEELQRELQPEVQVGYAAERAKYEATKVWYRVLDTVDAARAGDPAARQLILQVVGGVAAVLALAKFRKARKKKNQAKEAAKIAAAALAEADKAALRAQELAESAQHRSRKARRAAKKAAKEAKKAAK